MNIITWIKNTFGPEIWNTVSVEPAEVTVEYHDCFPMKTIPAKLIKEESNKGNVRHWMKELDGVFKNKPYLIDITTNRPLNEKELLKTKLQ